MNSYRVHKFDESAVAIEEYFLPTEKLLVGNPKQSLWKHYSDASDKFFAGIWQSEVGKWSISYTEEEYCQLLQGVSIITDISGNAMRVSAGDHFVIPKGFVGTWEVVQPTKKIYVIYEA